jgi:hypothetical protein
MKCLALAGLPRVLAEPDADPVAVAPDGIEQQCDMTIKEIHVSDHTPIWCELGV